MKRILFSVLAWLAFCGWEVAHAQTGGGFPPSAAIQIKCIDVATGCNAAAIKVGQGACAINDGGTPVSSTTTTQAIDTYIRLINVPNGQYIMTANFQWGNTLGGGINWTNSFGWPIASASTMGGTVQSGLNSPSAFSTWGYQSCCMATSGWGGTNGYTTSGFGGSASGVGTWNYTVGPGTVGLNWGQSVAAGTTTVFTGSICLWRVK